MDTDNFLNKYNPLLCKVFLAASDFIFLTYHWPSLLVVYTGFLTIFIVLSPMLN
ncbi:undecaprenyl-phosphate galactose phosphotransferase [Citrobacter koseri]|uniref:Undecaprenyl-phosphate galactose phosphotransferase n=1 Tax=Citrobacter koseri TaxID=545 RepID=A0A2X2VU76_CITKO|nr:undecaprenyl-phosphate galactose phosphotransferase [Citrobacter koseri]